MKKFTYKLSEVSSPRGAPMGRRDTIPEDIGETPVKLYMRPLRWVDGDYDQGGAYWGSGSVPPTYNGAGGFIYDLPDRIWQACGEISNEEVEVFVRAKTREEAKEKVREAVPGARFFR